MFVMMDGLVFPVMNLDREKESRARICVERVRDRTLLLCVNSGLLRSSTFAMK